MRIHACCDVPLPLPLPDVGCAASKMTAPTAILPPSGPSAKLLRAHSCTAGMLGAPDAVQRLCSRSTGVATESSRKLVLHVNRFSSGSAVMSARER